MLLSPDQRPVFVTLESQFKLDDMQPLMEGTCIRNLVSCVELSLFKKTKTTNSCIPFCLKKMARFDVGIYSHSV